MRKFVLTGLAAPALFVSSAFAADLPRRSYAPSPQPSYAAPVQSAYNWTGFYAGVNAGYAWGSFGDVGNVSFGKPSGFTLGGTLGYNHQFNNGFLLGAEGDLNWLNAKSSSSVGIVAAGGPVGAVPAYYTGEMNWLWTARARAGFAIERAMLFGTLGYAGANIEERFSQPGATTPQSASTSGAHHGWAAGLGIEYAFTNTLSMKAEYLYASLGKKTVFAAPYTTKVDPGLSIVRMGVNYHF
jgi:outer membrane immunogenic protein